MVDAGGGSIVNTAARWGLNQAPGHIAYNVSKAAVVAFTEDLAQSPEPPAASAGLRQLPCIARART